MKGQDRTGDAKVRGKGDEEFGVGLGVEDENGRGRQQGGEETTAGMEEGSGSGEGRFGYGTLRLAGSFWTTSLKLAISASGPPGCCRTAFLRSASTDGSLQAPWQRRANDNSSTIPAPPAPVGSWEAMAAVQYLNGAPEPTLDRPVAAAPAP